MAVIVNQRFTMWGWMEFPELTNFGGFVDKRKVTYRTTK